MNRLFLHWPGYYDVMILPPPELQNYAIVLSRRLRRSGGLWSLGKRAFFPHISLYHIPVIDEDLESFLGELQHVVDATPFGTLETTGFDFPVITVNKPDWLRNLHRSVVQRTVRYFNRKYGAEKMWSLHRFSGRRLSFAKKYLREYGTPMAGMNFRPHITLSSFKNTEPSGIHFDVPRMSFRVDRVYVCELGQSHSCQRFVREIRLHH